MNKLDALAKFLAANKTALGVTAGIGAAGAAGAVAAPKIDDFITDQALKSMGRTAKRAVSDTADFAAEHPYMLSGLVGASGLAGAKLGEGGFSSLFDTVSPIKVAGLMQQPDAMQRQRRGSFR